MILRYFEIKIYLGLARDEVRQKQAWTEKNHQFTTQKERLRFGSMITSGYILKEIEKLDPQGYVSKKKQRTKHDITLDSSHGQRRIAKLQHYTEYV